jgi:hypothetical protein
VVYWQISVPNVIRSRVVRREFTWLMESITLAAQQR